MRVTKIIEAEFKKGFSEKTQKDWTLAKVELADGKTATGFQPVSEGDEVEVVKTDFGWQFRASKKARGTPQQGNDDSSKMLNMIYEKISNIEKLLEDSQALKVFDDNK